MKYLNSSSKIYIAGHTGMVGSAIVESLKNKGYTNLLLKLRKELDLLNQRDVFEFLKKEKPDYIIIAAAKVGGIIANNTYRAEFIHENLVITTNIIHGAYLAKVYNLLFLGSSCIYPRECPQPIKEEYLLSGFLEYTNEPYAISKIAGIRMCESYNIQYGTNYLSVMPTNLYGPNDNFDLEKSHVLPALMRKIYLGKCIEENNWDAISKDLNKRPIEGVSGKNTKNEILEILNKYQITIYDSNVYVQIWGSGKPLREFLWSEDLADACVFIMENILFNDLIDKQQSKMINKKDFSLIGDGKFNDKEILNTQINIGTGSDISIKDLAETIKQIIGFRGNLTYNTSIPDGTMKKLLNVSKLHRLGWKHKTGLNDGILKLYNWYLY